MCNGTVCDGRRNGGSFSNIQLLIARNNSITSNGGGGGDGDSNENSKSTFNGYDDDDGKERKRQKESVPGEPFCSIFRERREKKV